MMNVEFKVNTLTPSDKPALLPFSLHQPSLSRHAACLSFVVRDIFS
jgi:hypothetical protein